MVKTTIKETTEKFDKDGKLIERVTREEFTEDDTIYDTVGITNPSYTPYTPPTNAEPIKPWYAEPYCNESIQPLTGKTAINNTEIAKLRGLRSNTGVYDEASCVPSKTILDNNDSFTQAVSKCINS